MTSAIDAARAAALSSFVSQVTPRSVTEAQLAAAEATAPAILPGVLSDAEISEVLRLADGCPPDAVVSYGDAHEVRYLHRAAPRSSHLIERLIAAMRASEICGGSGGALHVRCVELHTYAVGGGLMERGHRDKGSAISLSALLTAPGGGGAFTTWDADGAAVEHALRPGDAVVFASEKTHNVSLVTSGTRQTVVIELWKGDANARDRYS